LHAFLTAGPPSFDDVKSRAIVEQMQMNEKEHANTANSLGAEVLPSPVREVMRIASQVMTTVAHKW